jgi:leukotriene-A4 hydrolase
MSAFLRMSAVLGLAWLLNGCGGTPIEVPAAQARNVAPVLLTPEATDVHSRAKPAEARVTHVALDLAADFAARTLSGTATLDIEARDDATALVLDTKGLQVSAVTDAQGRALPWQLGDADAILGSALSIQPGAARQVVVRYATTPSAAALQWLAPSQTAGRQQPYLFSQGQSILTRTWVPTQDSPGIRQTWEARIVAPSALRVVMSAEMLTPEGEPASEGRKAWRFRMQQPVAPYLIAIAIGDLSFRPLGPRSGVYTEPSMLEAAAAELVDLESMISAAEALYGPYRWGRYDLLVLPPSFPFGGMENPRLTFATPTILAGDRSLVSLVAHELAHSWSGNLVTNATWADFWLNEGFTTYFENRIMEAVYGRDFADMLADLGWDELQAGLADMDGGRSPDSRLRVDLAGRDPDDGVNDIAYEKGATFLRTLEELVGRERWDTYLKGYFDRHAFQPQTTSGFLADLRTHLVKGDAALEQRMALVEWTEGTGLPAQAVHRRSPRFPAIDATAAAFAAQGAGALPAAEVLAAWSTAERVRFLNRLPRQLSVERLQALEQALQLRTQGNSEVLFAWLQLALVNRYAPAVAQAEAFLSSQGRRKFVLPLYTTLMGQGSWGQREARRIYAGARSGYHAVTVGSVDKVVGAPSMAGAP